MKNNLAYKIFFIVLQLLGIFIITFLLLHLIPGDPIQVMLGESASIADQTLLRSQLGLDQAIHIQLWNSFSQIIQGDFGYSIINQTPVIGKLIEAIKNTYMLAFCALIIALFFGLSGGIISAKYRDTIIDRALINLSLAFISIPHFLLGPLLILFFSIWLGLLPVSGMNSSTSIILPAFTLALSLLAIIIKMTRNCMIEIFESDAVRTARAKGLDEWKIIIHHIFRLALMPIVTIIGLQFGSLLSGAVITETIFSWNGLGKLLVESIQTRDYPVTQACVFVIAVSYIAVNSITEIIYTRVDPRVRTK
mgnify:CR=1 FL=1